MKLGDRVRTTMPWGCFRDKRGRFIESRGERHVLVHLDGDVAHVLLFAKDVVLDEPSEIPMSGAE